MSTVGILERATTAGLLSFVIKGGVALELRLRNRASATKDLDITLHHPNADLALTLERADQRGIPKILIPQQTQTPGTRQRGCQHGVRSQLPGWSLGQC